MASSKANLDESVTWTDVDDMTIISTGKPQMRIVLIQTAAGLKPPSGGYRGNYAHLQHLGKKGHAVLQTCWAYPKDIENAKAELKAVGAYNPAEWPSQERSTPMMTSDFRHVQVPYWKFTNVDGIKCVALNADVMIQAYPNNVQQEDAAKWIENGERPMTAIQYSHWLIKATRDFEATHILFNDAFGSLVAKNAMKFLPKLARVEIIHTLEQLPVGPFAGGISGGAMCPKELGLFKSVDAIVSVSEAVQNYALKHCQLNTTMLHNHALSYLDKSTGALPVKRDNWPLSTVVMINPAYVKGYHIFLEMAKENEARKEYNKKHIYKKKPVYRYIAYSAWGSNKGMEAELRAAGVEVRNAVEDMEPVYDEMSVLIMPSLWQEAWGITATEAQLRGIPVISSDVGGLPEAKRYVEPIIPVVPIDGQARGPDGYKIPIQNVSPFIRAVDRLLMNPMCYRNVAEQSYYVTKAWISSFDVDGMENLLDSIRKSD